MTKSKLIGFTVLAAVVFAVATYTMFSNSVSSVAEETAVATETTMDSETGFDLEKAMAKRSIGDENAPVVIEEYASLSCSHCASFHKNTFPELKEKYIDTGKVRFVYNDFPLNSPAMDAAIVARCLPEERYFQFIKFLFETQGEWAYNADYRKKIVQNAKLVGGSGEKLEACLGSEELRHGLTTRMQTASKDHEIKSTPSFIVNGEHTVRGAQSISDFSKIIDKLIEESPAN